MRRARLQLAVELPRGPASTRPILRIASRPSRGRLPCAARPRVSISNHAKPLWPIPICRSVGSVTTAASARHSRTRASAPMLANSSSTTAAMISRPRAKPRLARDPHGVDHRGDAALHVLRAASVQASVADHRLERARIPSTPTVSICPQNINDGPGAPLSRTADHIRSPGRGFLHDAPASRAARNAAR